MIIQLYVTFSFVFDALVLFYETALICIPHYWMELWTSIFFYKTSIHDYRDVLGFLFTFWGLDLN